MCVNPLSSSSRIPRAEYEKELALQTADVKSTGHRFTVDAKNLGHSASPNGVREAKVDFAEKPGQHDDNAPIEPSAGEAKAQAKADSKAGWGAYVVAQSVLCPFE